MADDGFSIRDAQPAEFARIGEIAVAAYSALEPIDDYIDEIRDTASRAAVARVLVAVEPDGTILGTVTYIPGPGPLSEREREDEAGFRVLAVDPTAQGRGVGRALAESCVELAVRDGRAGVAILTRPSMSSAHRLYESMGFARDRDDDWEFLPGEWLWGYRIRF
jgi:GNAT superfamily N-acetyltransferase